MKKWLRKQVAIISLSFSNIEKTMLSQKSEELDKKITLEESQNKGTLADSLLNGVVTAEVESLRWRMYKTLKAMEDQKTFHSDETDSIDGKGELVKLQKISNKELLKRIPLDKFDNYPLEIMVDNTPISNNTDDAIKNISLLSEAQKNEVNEDGLITATHGIITMNNYAINKPEPPIKINRDLIPKFELETYTKKLNVRSINDKTKLLEFYVSKYPDEFNRTSRLFISEVKKAIDNPRISNMLEIKSIQFITNRSIGTDKLLEYKYDVLNFDKIIEFDGYYVIKFICDVVINGSDIFEKYRITELDEKYKNKEKR